MNKEQRRNRHLQNQKNNNADDKGADTSVIDDDKKEEKAPLTEIQIADARLKSMTKQMTKVLGRTRYWMGDNNVPCATMEIKELPIIRGKKSEKEPRGVLIDNCDIIDYTIQQHRDEADIRGKAVYVTLNLRNSMGKMQDAILTSYNEEKLQAYISFDTYVDAGVRVGNTIITHAKAADGSNRADDDGTDEGETNHFAF